MRIEKKWLLKYVGDNVDRLCTVEYRGYSLVYRGTTGRLYNAARKQQGDKPLTLKAAKTIAKHVKPNDAVIICNGFSPDPVLLPRGEHDGVVGGIALARSINIGLKARTVFLTEESSVPVLKAGLLAAGLREFDLNFLVKEPKVGSHARGTAVQSFPIDAEEAKKESNRLLNSLQPSVIIAIEKAGRNEKGVYHTGYGNDMSAYTAKTDLLVDAARAKGIPTIGIIDFGNEIGSGNIIETVRKVHPLGAHCKCPCGGGIASVVETSDLIAATCCNFGAYGIIACLSRILNNLEMLHDVDTERRILKAVVKAGALSGTTLAPDLVGPAAVPLEEYLPLLQLLRTIILQSYRMYEADKLRR